MSSSAFRNRKEAEPIRLDHHAALAVTRKTLDCHAPAGLAMTVDG